MKNYLYLKNYVELNDDGQRIEIRDSNGHLFNEKLIVTELTSEKLPEYYIPCFQGGIGGYVCTSGIMSIAYDPSQYKTKINDLRYDKLYISYKYNSVGTKNYDVVVFGNEILPVLVGAVEHSGFNIDEILVQMFDSEKMRTTDKFMKTWKILYSRLEPYNSNKVLLSKSMSKRFKSRENADFDNQQISFHEILNPCMDEMMTDSYLIRDVWKIVDAW